MTTSPEKTEQGWTHNKLLVDGKPKYRNNIIIRDTLGRVVFEAIHGWNIDVQQGNAHRLVALWNACLSIPTEALESNVIQELVDACRRLVEDRTEFTRGDFNEVRAVLSKIGGAR